jgi:CheY-like chemotaxis protein
MIPKVLIIDDDQALRRLLEKEMEEYADFFSVVTAADGQEALQVLSDSDISVILSDLRMPGIDGFELMGLIIKQYPDIPVMAMTAYDKPKTKDVVMKSGAVDYLTKPVEGMGLFRRIMKILKKKDEGGSLNKVTLETYLQLVEMEEQTCTLRVRSQTAGKSGVLFFNSGRLMEARIGNLRGRDAAYEILSWSGVSLSIENECAVSEKLIDGELQALLLDAMRSRDEIEDDDIHPETDAAAQPKRNNGAASDTGDRISGVSGQTSNAADKKLSPVQSAEKKLITAMGTDNGIQDVYTDPQSAALIARVESLGQLFESGVLNVIYMNQNDKQVLVVPDEENVVVMLDKKVSREGAIAVFA